MNSIFFIFMFYMKQDYTAPVSSICPAAGVLAQAARLLTSLQDISV
jgi:hypothetical protein